MAEPATAPFSAAFSRGRVIEIDSLHEADPWEAPYVVKPINEGSSVGVQIVRAGDNRRASIATSWSFGKHALVEEYIPGRELTVAVLGERALVVTEIAPSHGLSVGQHVRPKLFNASKLDAKH